MGVESYVLRGNLRLYRAGSPGEFKKVGLPDHAVGIVADTGTESFYVIDKYDRKPTIDDVGSSYSRIGDALARELSCQGIYTKEVILTSSHPEVPIPEDITDCFKKERPALKALTLLWPWLVSQQHGQT